MNILNINKTLKFLFLFLFIVGIVIFAVKREFRFFEGNDYILFKPVADLPEGTNIDEEFSRLVSKFSTSSISSLDRNSKELKIVGYTEAEATQSLADQTNFDLQRVYPAVNQATIKAEYIWLASLLGVFTVGYVFVLKLRNINIRFKTFSIFAVKIILLFIFQTIAFLGLIALISRVYEIKVADLYAVLALNLVTAFMFIKLVSSESFSSLAGLYMDVDTLINQNKGNLLRLALILTLLLPFGFGVKIVSTLLFITLGIFFSIYALEFYNRANIEGARLSLPNKDTVSSMVQNIRVRKNPIMPSRKLSDVSVSSAKKKKTETKKKRKKEKNKNRR